MSTTDTIHNKKVATGNVSGPASYTAGGFNLDLSATFSTLDFLSLEITTVGANLPPVHYVYTLNNDGSAFAQGKGQIKLMRDRTDVLSVGTVTGQPSGVTVEAALTAAGTTTGSGHTHTMNHDHPSATSSTPTSSGAGTGTTTGVPGYTTHTHAVDIANYTGSTGSSTHAHNRDFEYDHTHPTTQAQTDAASTEIAAATNLSGTTWRYFAVGL